MCKDNDDYVVYVADNYTRIYDRYTLPDEIKVKLTMASAIKGCVPNDSTLSLFPLKLYSRGAVSDDNSMDEIGWRASDSYYCLCLSDKLLGKMGA
jgi:hypothetical protein